MITRADSTRIVPATHGRRTIGHQRVIHASGRRMRRLMEREERRAESRRRAKQ